MRLKGLLIAVLVWIAGASLVQAQRAVPSYQPSTPTLSPYLFLTRPDVGALPNYQTFVQPYKAQRAINIRQESQIRRLQDQVDEDLYAPAEGAATGIASRYNNFLHFYPGRTATPGSRGATTGPRR